MKIEDKKTKILALIGILVLLIFGLGATYAFFMVSTSTKEFTPRTAEATTPALGNVALTSGSNLSLSLTAADMMVKDTDVTYYASTTGKTTTATSVTIGEATVNGSGTFNCNYTLTISDNDNSLYDTFQSWTGKTTGQIILTINGVDYDFNTASLFPKEIPGTFTGLTSSNSGIITASLRIVNKKDVNQSDLAGKNITLTFDIKEGTFSCTAVGSDNVETLADYLISKASSTDLWNSTLEDDGYRYVGTNPDNYICFGTNDKDTCTGDTDKYMYRIIGIFEDEAGKKHAKLIKKEAFNTAYAWDSHESTDVDWNESDLYKGLNGSYFLTNTDYSYMQNTSWTNKIATWNYTMTNTKTTKNYNGNSVWGAHYYYEIGKTMYLHELNRSGKSSETCRVLEDTADCNVGEWKNLSTKISLMYASDYALSLGSDALSYTSDSDMDILKTGWIHFSNNDTNAPSDFEWTMTRWGSAGDHYDAWGMFTGGNVMAEAVVSEHVVRPVFYLESDVEIIGGTGTITDPFLLD